MDHPSKEIKKSQVVLEERHKKELIEGSGILPEVVEERGYKTIRDGAILERLGFAKSQCRAPGMLVPIWGVDGQPAGHQFKPDCPRTSPKGKPLKYETPAGSHNHLDCPPRSRPQIDDPSIPLWLTEGCKKVDALASKGLCAVAMTGVWNWKGRGAHGGSVALPDFDHIALKGREIYIVFDSDAATNRSVRAAESRLAALLSGRGAHVRTVRLPKLGAGKTGVDDYLVEGHAIPELQSLAKESPRTEEAEDKPVPVGWVEVDDSLYITVRATNDYFFAHQGTDGTVQLCKTIVDEAITYVPLPLPIKHGRPLEIVGLPDEGIATAPLREPEELFQCIRDHILSYVDISDTEASLIVYYILLTWFYPKLNTIGYLRFLADTGKGKTRALTVVGDLCFYPLRTGGASSFSGLARTQEKWRGTLVLDEADFNGDKDHQITKYLNLGLQSETIYILSDKENPREQEYFSPFAPKVIGMRQAFRDNATEGRLLSIDMHETTRIELPIILLDNYHESVISLRNQIARFALHHWQAFEGSRMDTFQDLPLEPRLKQLAMPLSAIFQLWPDGLPAFKGYLVARQRAVRRARSLSWEGLLVNLVLAIATGDEDLTDQHPELYGLAGGRPKAVTPGMVAKQMQSSSKAVTQSLVSVGFTVERHTIPVERDDTTAWRTVRTYRIPCQKVWEEILSRYYCPEDDLDDVPDPPDVLKSKRFTVSKNTENVSEVSHEQADAPPGKSDQANSSMTHLTDMTDSQTPVQNPLDDSEPISQDEQRLSDPSDVLSMFMSDEDEEHGQDR